MMSTLCWQALALSARAVFRSMDSHSVIIDFLKPKHQLDAFEWTERNPEACPSPILRHCR